MVTVAYTHELDQGCYPPWQFLMPGKEMTPLDIDMDELTERLAAENKLERVSAYRQLQGYSNQLSLLTAGAISLDDFDLPKECNVRPCLQDEVRVTTPGGLTTDTAFLVNRRRSTCLEVLPAHVQIVRLLLLSLDQGGPGVAGDSFATYGMKKMVHGLSDKIHRLIRDLKLAEKYTEHGIFTKAKLWSTYLYSLNKRPFGIGANATMKERMMAIFASTVALDHSMPVVQKYMEKIAHEWNMPCHTAANRQAVMDRVIDMKSFRHNMSSPRTQNWFAWNQCANEQME